MSNFIIFFDEKEGTSPLVRLLDQFSQIEIVHQIEGRGWEPFDIHNCGPMSLKDMKQCFNLIYSRDVMDMDKLNEIYCKSAAHPLRTINFGASIGLKMRFVSPGVRLPLMRHTKRLSQGIGSLQRSRFRVMMLDMLVRNDVKVLIAVRQDMLRWALSKYHGDGSGKSGHLQFKLASGEISREEIGKIHVNGDRLQKIVARCEQRHQFKRELIKELNDVGVSTYVICYEDFLDDRMELLTHITKNLGLNITEFDMNNVLENGTHFKKVHSNDLSEFVINHEEILSRFGDRFVNWSNSDST